ncbi:amino acid permease [Spirillospora sp. CA-255316]
MTTKEKIPPPDETPPTANADARMVEEFGYKQELKRSMGFFSTFAISFSLMSITTGLFANYGFGLQQAGVRFVWTWPIVGVGNVLIALCLAHLSTRVPLAGYAYQWSARMMGPGYGWFPGWFALVGWLTGTAGVAYAFSAYFCPYVGLGAGNGTIVATTTLVLVVWAVIHLFGMRVASWLNNFSVTAEIVGTLLVGVGLLIYALVRGHDHVSLTSHAGAGPGAVGFGAFAVSALAAAYTLTGFEGAADLAEESANPVRSVPRAIINSVVISAVAGFLVLVGFTLAIPNVDRVAGSPTPLLDIVDHYVGSVGTAFFMAMIFAAIFACGLINMAAVSRLAYSMARDGVLPGSSQLSRVNLQQGTPFVAIIVATVISILFTLVAKVEAIITSVSSVAVYTSYALIIIGGVVNRGGLKAKQPDAFTLGRFFKPVAFLAIAWIVVIVLALTLPAQNHKAGWSGLVVLALGATWYVVRIRRQRPSAHGRRPEDPVGER